MNFEYAPFADVVLTEEEIRIRQLQSYLECNELPIEGRVWLWNEIWDIKIAAASTATQGK